ncbi:HTH-type transcriptional repressor YcgE [Cronobacter sakazakii]|nr:HTH-type transcriptional repressor YcgE [Cronobacter sakazakii]
MLATLEKTSLEKGRALLLKMGRELPAGMLLDKVVLPLRLWLGHGHASAQLTRRARFDTLIIEYATFLMQTLRKRPASGLVVIAMNSHDPLSVWLEAIRFSGEGFRIDVLQQPVPLPDLTQFAADHYLIYSDVPLTPAQLALWQQWQLDACRYSALALVSQRRLSYRTPPTSPTRRSAKTRSKRLCRETIIPLSSLRHTFRALLKKGVTKGGSRDAGSRGSVYLYAGNCLAGGVSCRVLQQEMG